MCCLCRLPGEVLVFWRWHSHCVRRLIACPVPARVLWPQQDGHSYSEGEVSQRGSRWRAQGECRLPGERHPLGILRKHSWTSPLCFKLEVVSVGSSSFFCICVRACVRVRSSEFVWMGGGKMTLTRGTKVLKVFCFCCFFLNFSAIISSYWSLYWRLGFTTTCC